MTTTNERLAVLEVEYKNLDGKVEELKTENKDDHDQARSEIQKLRIEMGLKRNGARAYYIVGAIIYAFLTGNLADLKELPPELLKIIKTIIMG